MYPIVGPRLATYGVVQPVARQLGLATLGTLHQRIGEALTPQDGGGESDPVGWAWGRSTWGRVIGEQINDRYQAFADPRAEGQVLGVQAGIDLLQGSFVPGHHDVAGAYFGYLNGNMNVDGLVTNLTETGYTLTRTGTLNLNSYSLGAYWTHYGPSGWYLDAVLQGTRYGGSASANFAALGALLGTSLSTKMPTNGNGFVSSLEGGYPFSLPQLGPGFVLEPQGQLIYQWVGLGPANDGLGTVGLGSTSGVTGRLGLRTEWTILGPNGEAWQPYGRADLWRDWGGEAQTSFAGDAVLVPLVEQATRLEFAAGLTVKLSTNLSFYTQAGYGFAVAPSDARRDGVRGDLGLRLTW